MESAATVGHASLGVGQRRTMSVFVALKDDIAVVTDQDESACRARRERGGEEGGAIRQSDTVRRKKRISSLNGGVGPPVNRLGLLTVV